MPMSLIVKNHVLFSKQSGLPSWWQTTRYSFINVFYPINNGNWTEWSAIWSEIIRVISKSARVRFEITSMMSDQNCTTRSSITTWLQPFWNHRIQSVRILYFIDQEAGLWKSRNKKAFTSHFVFETEMMRHRTKMVRFKTEMMRFRAKNGAI